ncbi:MAG: hypothetical protein AAGE59_05470 [Cyanobacteria bacterium P01_F01_bin.86]
MVRLATLAILVVLGFSTTSCGFINGILDGFRGGGTESTEPSDVEDSDVATEEPDAATEEPDAVADNQEEGVEPFQEAILPGLPSAAEIALAELLPSTDANERLKEVSSDRPDPYAFVPVPPPPAAAPPAPEDSPVLDDGQSSEDAPQGENGSDGSTFDEEPFATGEDDFPSLEPLPTLPEPVVVASQVQIFGIAEVQGEVYAIVQAPGEPTSRYVKVGDRLANGTVLVKRIETRPSSEPLVVLEERGTEIALPVGSGGGTPEDGTTALSPPSQSSPSEIAVLPSSLGN